MRNQGESPRAWGQDSGGPMFQGSSEPSPEGNPIPEVSDGVSTTTSTLPSHAPRPCAERSSAATDICQCGHPLGVAVLDLPNLSFLLRESPFRLTGKALGLNTSNVDALSYAQRGEATASDASTEVTGKGKWGRGFVPVSTSSTGSEDGRARSTHRHHRAL